MNPISLNQPPLNRFGFLPERYNPLVQERATEDGFFEGISEKVRDAMEKSLCTLTWETRPAPKASSYSIPPHTVHWQPSSSWIA